MKKSDKKNILLDNDFLLSIINSANEGIYVVDSNREILIWNDAAARISGFSSDEIIGKRCQDNILDHTDEDGNNLCGASCPLSRAMESGVRRGPKIVFLRHRDGTRIPVEIRTSPVFGDDGKICGAVEIFQDVTDRLRNEKLMLSRKRKLETVLESIRDGILFIDQTGAISLMNRALCDMLHLDQGLLGEKIFDLPPDSLLAQAIVKSEKDFHRPGCNHTIRLKCDSGCPGRQSPYGRCWLFSGGCGKSGEYASCRLCPYFRTSSFFLERSREMVLGDRMFSVVSSFIEFGEEGAIMEVMTFRDVTTEKLSAVMDVAGAAAHELRQPLQIIIGALSMLEDFCEVNEETSRYFNAVEESCMRMDGIIKKLCGITRYRLMRYTEESTILDLGKSVEEPDLSGDGNFRPS